MGHQGRKGILLEDVIRAYVALQKQQRSPGPTNIRLELGTGSYTTIAQHLKTLALKKLDAPLLSGRRQHEALAAKPGFLTPTKCTQRRRE